MTDGPYLLGIDFGTGGARVGIFDPEGTPLVFSEREYTLLPSTASRRRGCILASTSRSPGRPEPSSSRRPRRRSMGPMSS